MITIKKYSNRKLYNLKLSKYILLSDICQMVISDKVFEIVSAETGEDITEEVVLNALHAQLIKQADNIDLYKSLIKQTKE